MVVMWWSGSQRAAWSGPLGGRATSRWGVSGRRRGNEATVGGHCRPSVVLANGRARLFSSTLRTLQAGVPACALAHPSIRHGPRQPTC